MTQIKCDKKLKKLNERCKIARFFKTQLDKYKNVKLLNDKLLNSGKVVYGVMTYKGETLFELDEDGYYILCYIISYYIILY